MIHCWGFMETLKYNTMLGQGMIMALTRYLWGGKYSYCKPFNFLNFWTKIEDFKNIFQQN